jgi:hypothetical protein
MRLNALFIDLNHRAHTGWLVLRLDFKLSNDLVGT